MNTICNFLSERYWNGPSTDLPFTLLRLARCGVPILGGTEDDLNPKEILIIGEDGSAASGFAQRTDIEYMREDIGTGRSVKCVIVDGKGRIPANVEPDSEFISVMSIPIDVRLARRPDQPS